MLSGSQLTHLDGFNDGAGLIGNCHNDLLSLGSKFEDQVFGTACLMEESVPVRDDFVTDEIHCALVVD